jgi:hypothetical protein
MAAVFSLGSILPTSACYAISNILKLYAIRKLLVMVIKVTHCVLFQLWEVYNERRCIRTYYGHRQAVRDVCFNNVGTQFLSAGE